MLVIILHRYSVWRGLCVFSVWNRQLLLETSNGRDERQEFNHQGERSFPPIRRTTRVIVKVR